MQNHSIYTLSMHLADSNLTTLNLSANHYHFHREFDMSTPRVYIACLASYNAGILHGKWTDAIDADAVNEAIADVIKTSTRPDAEEWAIHDYEGFGNLSTTLGENPYIDALCAVGEWLNDYDDKAVVEAYLEDFGTGIDTIYEVKDAKADFEDRYQGSWNCFTDFATEMFHECYPEVPDYLQNYIDYDAFARDLSYDYHVADLPTHDVAVFRTS